MFASLHYLEVMILNVSSAAALEVTRREVIILSYSIMSSSDRKWFSLNSCFFSVEQQEALKEHQQHSAKSHSLSQQEEAQPYKNQRTCLYAPSVR